MERDLITTIVPASVATAETFGDPAGAFLFDDEEAVVSHAVDRRRREFTAGRHCARRALGRLGIDPLSLPPGHRGAPRWPAGVVGSITHCDEYRAAAVGWARDLLAIGIDAEPHAPLPGGVAELIARPEERDRIAELTQRRPDVHWDRLWFSAKESVYKTWSPLTHQWLDFDEAAVDIEPDGGAFSVRLLRPLPVVGGARSELAGRWLVGHDLVLTAICLTR